MTKFVITPPDPFTKLWSVWDAAAIVKLSTHATERGAKLAKAKLEKN